MMSDAGSEFIIVADESARGLGMAADERRRGEAKPLTAIVILIWGKKDLGQTLICIAVGADLLNHDYFIYT